MVLNKSFSFFLRLLLLYSLEEYLKENGNRRKNQKPKTFNPKKCVILSDHTLIKVGLKFTLYLNMSVNQSFMNCSFIGVKNESRKEKMR